MPLCFMVTEDSDQRWLTLDVDDNGFVTTATTTKNPPGEWPTNGARWLEIFDEPTRAKLRDAGVFPTDEELRGVRNSAR
jgi:hypothetical protein